MVTKICDTCRYDREALLFGRNQSKPDGLQSTCKECRARLSKAYQDANKEKIKAKKHEYYLNNKVEITKKTTAYSVANREKCRGYFAVAKAKLKSKVFAHYGNGRCTCGKDDIEVLTIDHVNGGGNKHRKDIGITGAGYNFYRWLNKNAYPEGFQVLC